MKRPASLLGVLFVFGYAYVLRDDSTALALLSFISQLAIFSFLVFRLIRLRSVDASLWLVIAFGALAIADSIYFFKFNAPEHEALLSFQTAEILYTAFIFALLAFFIRRDLRPVLDRTSAALSLATAVFFAAVNLSYILIPFFSRTPVPSFFHRVNSAVYALLVVFLVASLIPPLLRTNEHRNHLFLQTILFLTIVDFSLRYGVAMPENSSTGSWIGHCWELAMPLLLIQMISAPEELLSRRLSFVGARSLRVIFACATFITFLFFVLALHFLGLSRIGDAFQLTNVLILGFFLWLGANTLSVAVSRRILAVRSIPLLQLSPRLEDGNAEPRFSPIAALSNVHEFDALISSYNDLIGKSNDLLKRLAKRQRMAAIGSMAAQVAHDIRSPLFALQALSDSVSELPEADRGRFRGAIGRIREIADELVEQSRTSGPEVVEQPPSEISEPKAIKKEIHHLPSLLRAIVVEKNLQFRDRPGVAIELDDLTITVPAFVDVDAKELKRVLSNLVNNGVEALKGKGAVSISIHPGKRWILLSVEDDGEGIPQEVLPKLMKRHASFGKPSGSGLGLFHAKQVVEAHGGEIAIRSDEGRRTQVTLRLPRAEPPTWFVPRITIRRDRPVVVVDDEAFAQVAWAKRFSRLTPPEGSIAVHNFHSYSALKEHLEVEPALREALFLIDYEFRGEEFTGLDIITEIGIADRAILVTGNFENGKLRQGCLDAGAKLLSKDFIHSIPIIFEEPAKPPPAKDRPLFDAVLVTQDTGLEEAWLESADKAGKEMVCFPTAGDLMAEINDISPESPISVDLAADAAKKLTTDLKKKGFSAIHDLSNAESTSAARSGGSPTVRSAEPPWT